MKKILFLAFSVCVGVVSFAQQVVIKIQNPLAVQRKEEVVAISWSEVLRLYPAIDTNNLKVADQATGKELAYQLEYKGESAPQNLLVLASVKASAASGIVLTKGKRTKATARTYGRYVPERFDDFAWENDKVAFRMYGKALEARPKENANGIDVWSKRTPNLIIDKWYRTGDYHADHGDGMDYYKVGATLGAGDIAPFVNDSIWFSKNYRRFKVLDNGPIRTRFRLEYDAWDVAGRTVQVTKTITLDAGEHVSRVDVNYTVNDGQPLPVVNGIVKRDEPGTIILDEQRGIMVYEEPAHGMDGITRLGAIAETHKGMEVKKDHLFTHQLALPGKTLTYYFGATWSRAGYFSSTDSWYSYLKTFQLRQKNPVKIIK